MIVSWRGDEARTIFEGDVSRHLPREIQNVARRKLVMLNAAGWLDDLRLPPGNRLERLRGNREGQYSIRVNDQYRICFRWDDNGTHDVEIVDYH
jgi:toxin HigB-1